jgi:hypothetical protein
MQLFLARRLSVGLIDFSFMYITPVAFCGGRFLLLKTKNI